MAPDLVRYVLKGNTEEIEKFAMLKAKLFAAKAPEGGTILHIATRRAIEKAVQEILNSDGYFLVEKNNKGETPLHIATKNRIRAALFSMFCHYAGLLNCQKTTSRDAESGASATVISWKNDNILMMQDNQGNTPLHNAARSSCEEMVKRLLEANHEPLSIVNAACECPLSLAIDARLAHTALFIINKDESSSLASSEASSSKQMLLHGTVIREEYREKLTLIYLLKFIQLLV